MGRHSLELMSLNEKITTALTTAMKAKDSNTVSTLRLLTSALKNEQIEKQSELQDEDIQAVVKRQVKQLKDALKDYESGGRVDLKESSEKEIKILEEYLPEEMTEVDLKKVVLAVVKDLGEVGPSDMGKVMGAVMKEVSGRADGNRVRELVQKNLNSA
jgi:uncharacterized protein